jgi:hypothetical protein
MTTPGSDPEHVADTPEVLPIPGMPPSIPPVFGSPSPADAAPGVADLAPTWLPSSLPYAGYTSAPSVPVATPDLPTVSGVVPPSGYWLPPGYALPPGYILPPGYAFPPGYALPAVAAPEVAGAPSEAPSAPKRQRRGRLLAAIIIPLALVLVASSTLAILGIQGVGPLATAIHHPFPTFLHWSGQSSPAGLTLAFVVAASRDKISEMDVTYNSFFCSDSNGQSIGITSTEGPDRVFPSGTWSITGNKFSTDEPLSFTDPSGNTIIALLTVDGQFAADGNSLSGTWEFDSFVSCSGTFTAMGS